ncbi:MAG: two-component regulator propeller domain-containing protein [Bacteroidota bacterium]
MLLRISIFACCLLNATIGMSQSAWTFFNTVNSPLPENSVRCITSAPSGAVWIGTDYGLASYDGSVWTVYNTMNSGIPDNSIRSLLIDGNFIWVGTFMGGLARFDGTTWNTYNTLNSFIPDDFVRSLARDTAGNIWVGTIGGLGLFDGTNWTIFNMNNTPLLSNNISGLWSDSSGTIVGTINGGVGFYNNGIWQHFTIWNSNLPDNSSLGVMRDTAGVPWFSTPANGLSAYVGGIQFLTFSTISSGIASNSTTCLAYRPQSDEIWLGSSDEGLIRKSGINFTSYGTSNATLPDDVVQCVHVDGQGIVWAGMQTGGVVKLDPDLLLGLANIESTYHAFVYPNPTTDFLHINLESIEAAEIIVFDGIGAKVKENLYKSPSQQITIDVSNLMAGRYQILIRQGGHTSSVGFMKTAY